VTFHGDTADTIVELLFNSGGSKQNRKSNYSNEKPGKVKDSCSVKRPSDCGDLDKSTCKSGIYKIYPEKTPSFKVFCEMEKNGGGWTVFQRRMNGKINFFRKWESYKTGFGNLNGEHWLGKNNIKVFNFPRRDRQNLRKDFIEMVKKDLDVSLEERDVVAIHRLPAVHEPSPLIVRFFNSDVKRSVMRVRKQLNGKVKFVDDVTQRNMELIHRLEKSNHFEQVWYFNCGVYGRTECGNR
ncbi:Hypothetical predicted protein, partial [Mytilus galloprovincialis]